MPRPHLRRPTAAAAVGALALLSLGSFPVAATAAAESPSLTVTPASGPSLADTGDYTLADDLQCEPGQAQYIWLTPTEYDGGRLVEIPVPEGASAMPGSFDPGRAAEIDYPFDLDATGRLTPVEGVFPVDVNNSWLVVSIGDYAPLAGNLPAGAYTLAATCFEPFAYEAVTTQNDAGQRIVTAAWNTVTVDASGAWSVGTAPAAASTATAVTATPHTDNTVTLTATVSSGDAAVGAVGTVKFSEGSTSLGEQALSAAGVASVTTPSLSAGTHDLVAEFVPASGDYTGSTGTVQVSIGAAAAATQTAITATLGTGNTATLTAAVTSGGSPVTGGTVQFRDGTIPVGQPVTVANGSAVFTTPALNAGTHVFSAAYTPASASYSPSASADAAISVGEAPAEEGTSLALAAIPAISGSGQLSVGLGVVVFQDGSAAADATGSVRFTRNGAAIGEPVTVTAGVAALTDSGLTFDTDYRYRAEFTPAEGSKWTTAQSAEVAVSVKSATLLTGGATITPGQAYRVIAPDGTFVGNEAVTGVANSTPTPLGTGTANAAGGVAFTFQAPSGLEPGAHSIVLTGASGRTYTLAVSVANGQTNRPASFATDWIGQIRDTPALLAGLVGALVVFAAAGLIGWNVFWRRRHTVARR